jgi:predicted permease
MGNIPLWRRYARIFGADPKADVRDELRFHIEAKADDLIAAGWTPDAARREAERQFGDIRAVQRFGEQMSLETERGRARREFWGGFLQDFRHSVRALRRDWSFALIVTLVLLLGIGANTAVFSVVNTVLLRPLPFPESAQLAWLAPGKELKATLRAAAGLSVSTYTVAAYEEFQKHNRSFQSVTAYNPFFGNSQYTLIAGKEPVSVSGVMVACNFFPTLGVQPALGRHFTSAECLHGGSRAVMLTHSLWQAEFSADVSVIGRSVRLGPDAYTVVGVLPSGFDFGAVFSPGTRFDVFVPADLVEMRRWGNTLAAVGRLKPGVSIEQAQAESDVLFPQLKAAHPDWYMIYASTVTGLKDFVSGRLRRSVIVLWAATGLILLIVCVNLSNLLLARSIARRKEFAVRTALGAGRGRLIRQLLTEGLVLAGVGSSLGLALAVLLTRWLARQGSIALPLLSSVRIDASAVLWTLVITLCAAATFTIGPALGAFSAVVSDGLRESARGTTSGRGHANIRSILVISEVALACVLLAGSGLLLRSFRKVLQVDLGFQPSQAAAIKIDYPDTGDAARRGALLEEMLSRIQTIPGVEAAGITDMLPLGRNRSWNLAAKGIVYPKDEILVAVVRIVTPGYLRAMGMRVQEGRDFTWADKPKSERVAIINRAAARRFWHSEDPLGRLALIDGMDTRVIGVLADVREHNLEDSAGPEMYLPVTQAGPEGADLVVRSALDPATLAPSVMAALRSLNPAQPATELRPLETIVDLSVSPRRFVVLLISAFAALGLVLASLGIYGVISYTVAQQTQEIGVRMALGATVSQVRYTVVGKALRLALAGIAAGLIASLVASRGIASLLFDTTPTDPTTFAGVIGLLALVALLAGYLPAHRASKVNPSVALRGM